MIVGARPNFMKAAPVIDALESRRWATITLVHTGQHYSREMSDLFFEALGLPKPQVDLQVGSGAHGEQTGQIMIRLEPLLQQHHPDLVIVFGDVNSTVAAARCAAKLGIPVLCRDKPRRRRPDLWDGHAAERIVDVLERQFHTGSSVSGRMETAPISYSSSWTSPA